MVWSGPLQVSEDSEISLLKNEWQSKLQTNLNETDDNDNRLHGTKFSNLPMAHLLGCLMPKTLQPRNQPQGRGHPRSHGPWWSQGLGFRV